jgi:anti-sigma factor RsiW
MNCNICKAALPNLLLDPTVPENAAARAHIAGCTACAQEFASLQATLSLLDTWKAPEVSPYFDQKLAIRLREMQSAPAAGWYEQLRTRLLFNTGRQFRPMLASAMALVLIAGGGSVGIATFQHPHSVVASAAVKDLQILDNNEQSLQQVDQILQEDSPAANSGAALPRS